MHFLPFFTENQRQSYFFQFCFFSLLDVEFLENRLVTHQEHRFLLITLNIHNL